MRFDKTSIRKNAFLASSAVFFASFCLFLGAGMWYSSTRTTEPQPALGRIYPHHYKGSPTVYLTASEATGVTLLCILLFLGFAGTLGTYKVERNSFGEVKETRWSRRDAALYLSVAVCYSLLAVLGGPAITQFAASHGVIMNWADGFFGGR